MSSIRTKITLGYYGLAAVVVAFALFAYFDLGYLERRVAESSQVSAFQEDILEMRRHEKNFLLYLDPTDRADALGYATAAGERLAAHGEVFAGVAHATEMASVRRELANYRALLGGGAGPLATEVSAAVRVAGHALSGWGERFSERERALLAESVGKSKQALFVSVAVVAILGVLAGQLVARVIAAPLRRLEEELKPISEGRFHHFHQVSKDREIVSLTGALNRMLDELEARRRLVLQSEKLASLGVLASGVAHELNNPLGNISASCQILLEELDSPDREARREWLEQIDSETERGRRIVRTLLDYSRRDGFRAERLVLAEVLEKCLVLLRRELPDRNSIRLDIAPGLAVCGDERQLQQVFINLIKNAIDAGGAGATLLVRGRMSSWRAALPADGAHIAGDVSVRDEDDLPLAVIDLEDDGPGIPPGDLTKVFDPFFTTREPGHGVGLGLYVVEEIVREHGGCIGVANRPEGGCRFTLWLPCRQGVAG